MNQKAISPEISGLSVVILPDLPLWVVLIIITEGIFTTPFNDNQPVFSAFISKIRVFIPQIIEGEKMYLSSIWLIMVCVQETLLVPL